MSALISSRLVPYASPAKTEPGAHLTTPIDWHENKLQDVARPDSSIGYGIVQPGSHIRDGVPVLSIKDLANPSLRSVHRSSRKIESAYRRSRVKSGDVLISVKGTTGRVGIVPDGFEGNISRDVARLRVREEHDAYFWYQLLQSTHAQRLLQLATVGSTRQELSIATLRQLHFAYPSKAEQRAIAEALGDQDAYVDALRRAIAKKQAIKQGMMQRLLTGETRLPGFTHHWHTVLLGEIARTKTGSRNSQDKNPFGKYPFFVRSATVERIDRYSFDCEAVLVPGEGGIGSIFHYINGKFEVHQRVYKISDFTSRALGKFVYYYLQHFFGRHAMENSVKATVDSLRLPTFRNFPMNIPSDMSEQQAIVQALDDADEDVVRLNHRLAKAKAVKQGMMQELLTGRTRLPVVEGVA